KHRPAAAPRRQILDRKFHTALARPLAPWAKAPARRRTTAHPGPLAATVECVAPRHAMRDMAGKRFF
ncbi:MAG: hypothetical protein AAFR44_17545, partial [Pseudomonadota bacterium]